MKNEKKFVSMEIMILAIIMTVFLVAALTIAIVSNHYNATIAELNEQWNEAVNDLADSYQQQLDENVDEIVRTANETLESEAEAAYNQGYDDGLADAEGDWQEIGGYKVRFLRVNH